MSHPLTPLVRRPVCQIEHCRSCDVLHLTIGPVTLRLEPGAARQIAHALAEALERLESAIAVVEPVTEQPLVN